MAAITVRASRKASLLEAATRVVQRDGVGALTLDAVARECGVSKGGVLYHFPTKEALVLGMVNTMVDDFENDVDTATEVERSAGAEVSHGRWLRGYMRASLQEEAVSPQVLAALMAGVAINPRLLDPLRSHFVEWQQQAAADGLDATWATIIRLAIDGLWFADLFDLAPPRGALRKHLIDTLLSMSRRKGGTS